MRRKAIVMSETLRLIIAVISLLLLAYLLVQLYGLFSTKTEYEQAKSTLNAIVGKTEGLSEQEKTHLITGSKDWYIVYYDKEIIAKDVNKGMPKQCDEKNCLCICPTQKRAFESAPTILEITKGDYADYFYLRGSDFGEGLRFCENEGICVNLDNAVIDSKYNPDHPNDYRRVNVNWISLHFSPVTLSLIKKDGKIVISKKEGK